MGYCAESWLHGTPENYSCCVQKIRVCSFIYIWISDGRGISTLSLLYWSNPDSITGEGGLVSTEIIPGGDVCVSDAWWSIYHVISNSMQVYVELIILYHILDLWLPYINCLWFFLLHSIIYDTFCVFVVSGDWAWWLQVDKVGEDLIKCQCVIDVIDKWSQFGLHCWW